MPWWEESCVWGHIERATARVQMCRGSDCPVRVRTDAGWIVRDGAAGRARCGSTAGTTCVWPRREVELQNFSPGSKNTDRKYRESEIEQRNKQGEAAKKSKRAGARAKLVAQEQWSTAPPTLYTKKPYPCSCTLSAECCTPPPPRSRSTSIRHVSILAGGYSGNKVCQLVTHNNIYMIRSPPKSTV